MDISKKAKVCSNSSDIPIFQKNYSRSVQYGGILCKDSKNPKLQQQANYNAQDKADDDTFQCAKEKD